MFDDTSGANRCVSCPCNCVSSQYVIFQGKIFGMFKELFSAAVELAPPRGMGAAPQSRAMYAIDLMLKWDYNDKSESSLYK